MPDSSPGTCFPPHGDGSIPAKDPHPHPLSIPNQSWEVQLASFLCPNPACYGLNCAPPPTPHSYAEALTPESTNVTSIWRHPGRQRASLIAQLVKNLPAMQETLVPGSGRSAGEGIGYPLQYSWASLVAQLVKKNLLIMQESWVRSLGWEDPLEKGKATHSSILAWRIPWTV